MSNTQAVQEVLKARVSAKGIQLGVGGDPGRGIRALGEGFSQPQECGLAVPKAEGQKAA
jgi:hypothetical protein